MNSQAHWWSAYLAISHLAIGLSVLLNIGPQFLPPSWRVIYMVLPDGWDKLYPHLWVSAGTIGALGVRWPASLRLAFRMSAVLFLVWGLAGIPALMWGYGGNIPGIAANIFTAGAAWVLAHYVTIGERGDAVNVEVAHLAEQLYQDDDVGR